MNNINFLREQILANAAHTYGFKGYNGIIVVVSLKDDERYQASLVGYKESRKTLLTGNEAYDIEETYKSLFNLVAREVAKEKW